jgi:hypothetical protein
VGASVCAELFRLVKHYNLPRYYIYIYIDVHKLLSIVIALHLEIGK